MVICEGGRWFRGLIRTRSPRQNTALKLRVMLGRNSVGPVSGIVAREVGEAAILRSSTSSELGAYVPQQFTRVWKAACESHLGSCPDSVELMEIVLEEVAHSRASYSRRGSDPSPEMCYRTKSGRRSRQTHHQFKHPCIFPFKGDSCSSDRSLSMSESPPIGNNIGDIRKLLSL